MSRSTTIRVAVQDRRRLFREGVALLLGDEPDLDVVVIVATGRALLEAVGRHTIDLIIFDVEAGDAELGTALNQARRRNPELAVLGTVSGDPTAATRARRSGVRSVITRNAGSAELLAAVRGSSQPTRATAPTRRRVSLERPTSRLSAREIEILAEISAGRTTSEVAAAMGISPKTVENHKRQLFAKLGVQNQAHAVAVAMRRGLVKPTPLALQST
jgi:DNA-binding NarL/FixJ family response regulator